MNFDDLRRANVARCEQAFYAVDSRSATDWACKLGEEVGEVQRIANRIREGKMSVDDARPLLADELADVQTYVDLLAARFEIDLAKATVKKFNEVSDRKGSSIRLPEVDDGAAALRAKLDYAHAMCGELEAMLRESERLREKERAARSDVVEPSELYAAARALVDAVLSRRFDAVPEQVWDCALACNLALGGVSSAPAAAVEASPHAAFAIVTDGDAKVLAVYRADRGWNLPGGKVKDGEDGASAAARGLLEETGVNSHSVRLVYVGPDRDHAAVEAHRIEGPGWFRSVKPNTVVAMVPPEWLCAGPYGDWNRRALEAAGLLPKEGGDRA